MSNSFLFKDKTYVIGDTISVIYKLKEGEKERQQVFKGILIRVKGHNLVNRMVTVRKISKIGIGVEKIFPLSSPNIVSLNTEKKGKARKAKLYFIRKLSEAQTRHELYRQKKSHIVKKTTPAKKAKVKPASKKIAKSKQKV